MSKVKMYEAYICKYDGEVVYVGEGAKGRHKHCSSGVSHVYELNKLHFHGDVRLFEITVKTVLSKEEAQKLEKDYILKYNPKFNKVFVNNGRGEKGAKSLRFKKSLLDAVYNYKTNEQVKKKLSLVFEQFLYYHTYDMLKDEGIVLQKLWEYRKLNLDMVANMISSYTYGSGASATIPKLFKIIIEECYFDHFGKRVEVVYPNTRLGKHSSSDKVSEFDLSSCKQI